VAYPPKVLAMTLVFDERIVLPEATQRMKTPMTVSPSVGERAVIDS
jgi:hypothetical protein